MNRLPPSLIYDAVHVAEQAAIACHDWIGRGNDKAADQAAVDAMRASLMQLDIAGTVVIGEGERDEAPMLYIGEKVGKGHDTINEAVEVDIALDPLEGTTICATQGNNSLAVIAFAPKGAFLHAPDVYMQKIAVGPAVPQGRISLENSVQENMAITAKALDKNIKDVTVCLLDRERNQPLIEQVLSAGGRIKLIGDGDIFGAMETVPRHHNVDIYMGSGGAPEGVLTACALRAIGGDFQGKLLFRNDDERGRASKTGITDFDKIYSINELATGDEMIFCAAAVTDGALMRGVCHKNGKYAVNTLVIDLASHSQRVIYNKML
ncbi:MAG: class II fructose-bisphosphatase [Alphaproteobacteria bacterium]|nr:class II fructose-bisphosphatase [Alphaproteobacteria bacterium]